jgi:hypothetical protein
MEHPGPAMQGRLQVACRSGCADVVREGLVAVALSWGGDAGLAGDGGVELGEEVGGRCEVGGEAAGAGVADGRLVGECGAAVGAGWLGWLGAQRGSPRRSR